MKTNWTKQLMVLAAVCGLPTGVIGAETPAEALEQGVQLQETEGDLDGAIRRFEAVLRADGKIEKLAAEARYRLAQCFLEKGDEKRAKEQVEALRGGYPAENRWVVKAASLMPPETKFHGVPWTDGKAYRYAVLLPNGDEVGQMIAATRKVEVDGEAAWEAIMVRAAGTYALSRTRFAEDGYRSLDCRWYMRGIGDKLAVFGNDGVVRVIDAESEKEIDTFDSASRRASDIPLYENEQLVQLIRALSTKIGTKQKTVLISSLNGAVPIEFDLEVTAHEEVMVAAGTFQCAKIETNLKQTFYIAVDGGRELVRMDVGAAKIDLAAVVDWNGEDVSEMASKHFGCALSVPGAMVAMPAVDNKEVFRQQYWSTDFAGRDGLLEINWTKNLVEEARKSSRECAEHMIGLAGKAYEDWGVVDGSWEEVEVAGIPGVAVRVKGTQGEITVREIHVYALGEDKAVIYRMNYGPKEEAAARMRALELVGGLKWSQ
jgi:hypothetical protein